MDHYSRLLTDRELTDQEMELWYQTVEDFAPDGVVLDWDDDENQDCTEEGDEDCGDEDFEYVYLIELRRHLQDNEAEFVVSAWERRYQDDFEIEISHLYRADSDVQRPFEITIDSDTRSKVLDAASKFIHNRWVDAKTMDGWRYGLDYNEQEKTNPIIRDWDSLPESYRKIPQLTEKELLDFFARNKNLFK